MMINSEFFSPAAILTAALIERAPPGTLVDQAWMASAFEEAYRSVVQGLDRVANEERHRTKS
ncbi:hypothetical protein [Variovorax sp. N23]|uniref:hypothetical protein n=1 Tax=Variovorax sp. N23 TaxID=2980555 RepID=UPI0021C6A29E|nr:hypothetical protein [Variovorax sp. N23]MCU4121597.1 hypothetical protein [Variovorax sp. N23]